MLRAIKRGFWAAGLMLLWAGAATAACAPDRVDLRGDGVEVSFTVELAQTPEEHATGLMHRESMETFSGMLFIYDRPRDVAFWMRNTLIPLDMIFLDETGRVTKVHANAVPLDETPIPSEGPVRAVLEINGGLSAALGLTPGAVMRHPAFAQAGPVWPCD